MTQISKKQVEPTSKKENAYFRNTTNQRDSTLPWRILCARLWIFALITLMSPFSYMKIAMMFRKRQTRKMESKWNLLGNTRKQAMLVVMVDMDWAYSFTMLSSFFMMKAVVIPEPTANTTVRAASVLRVNSSPVEEGKVDRLID